MRFAGIATTHKHRGRRAAHVPVYTNASSSGEDAESLMPTSFPSASVTASGTTVWLRTMLSMKWWMASAWAPPSATSAASVRPACVSEPSLKFT